MKVLEVEFHKKVKFPTAKHGQGVHKDKVLIDHAESPHTQHTMEWNAVTNQIVVTHVTSGVTIGIPYANIVYMRPPLHELLAGKDLPTKPETPAAKK